jgi:class 3 adenylate cyclase
MDDAGNRLREELSDAITERVHEQIRSSIGRGGAKPEGTVTILFTDVEGSTELVRDLGDESARSILRRHDEIVRDTVQSSAGTEIEHPGDSFMIAFSTARSGIDCALDIQRDLSAERRDRPETPRVRMGMDTGEVIAEEKGYFGATVFRASRIADMAEGGQIVVSETTKALGQAAGHRFQDLGDHELKGMQGAAPLRGCRRPRSALADSRTRPHPHNRR